MTHHYWSYVKYRYWKCLYCGAACAEPNAPENAKATCPGPKKKK